MRITSILENTTLREDMMVEHGLSLYIESEGQRILFDMGQSDLFFENAKTLGIDLSKVDLAVLSHGHHDHGGGLRKFLEINDHAPVYIQKDAFRPYYNGTERYIGIDPTLQDSPRLVFASDELCINDSLSLFSCNGWERKYPPIASGLNEKIGDRFVADEFRHEQYLLIKEKGKRVLISGCSHKGILDIAEWFLPDVLVGGFHYSKLALDERLAEAARTLAKCPTSFYTCHCTGKEQFEWMRRYMPSLAYLSCGESIVLE